MAIEILEQYKGKLDCQKCDDTLKKERGHYEKGIIPFLIDGKRVFQCPLTLIAPLSYEYIKAFSFYEKQFLPNGQGWINESNKYLQAMMLIESTLSKLNNSTGQVKHVKYRP